MVITSDQRLCSHVHELKITLINTKLVQTTHEVLNLFKLFGSLEHFNSIQFIDCSYAKY